MIDTEALRKKVIDLAIRGKLTKQLPEDGTAEELYAQIQAEKARLVKERKIKKEKPLPIIEEDEIPFEIPKNWKWSRWGDLSEKIQYGYNAPAKESGRIKMVRISDIQDGRVKWDTVPYCDIDESDIKDYLLNENDILFARTGGTVGKSYLVTDIPENAVFAGYLIRTSCSDNICASYMKFFMESDLYWKQLQNKTIAFAQPNCNGKTLAKMIVPLPPLAEQKRIADKIDSVLSEIDIIDAFQSQYCNNLEALKSKIIDAGIRGKLTEQLPTDGTAEELYAQIQAEKARLVKEGKIKKEKPLPAITADEIPFEIPKNWKWVRWGNVINIVSARRVHQSDWRNKGVPFYRAREIARLADEGSVNNDLFISEELYNEFSKSGVPKSGDLMVTGVGTLGKTYVVRDNDRFYYKDASVLCFENIAGLNPPYLKLLMDSSLTHSQIGNNSGGTTVDTLTMVRMNRYIFPLPPLAEQQRIADRIDEILQVIQ